MIMKIHIERDFSFVEFEVQGDPATGEGIPTAEQLCKIFDRLPSKNTQPLGPNGLRQMPESAQRAAEQRDRREQRQRRSDPPATANQRRVLERHGEWVDGMTKSEASEILNSLGF